MKNSSHIAILGQANSELLREIVKAAELRLSTQVSLAIAADQRAMTFLGFLLTIDVFLVGSAIAASTADTPSPAIAMGAGVAAIGFGIAAVFAYLAGKPSKFHVSGLDPEDWFDDIHAQKTPEQALPELAEFYNRAIGVNRISMDRSANQLKLSAIIAGATVLCSSVIASLLILFWDCWF